MRQSREEEGSSESRPKLVECARAPSKTVAEPCVDPDSIGEEFELGNLKCGAGGELPGCVSMNIATARV